MKAVRFLFIASGGRFVCSVGRAVMEGLPPQALLQPLVLSVLLWMSAGLVLPGGRNPAAPHHPMGCLVPVVASLRVLTALLCTSPGCCSSLLLSASSKSHRRKKKGQGISYCRVTL